VFLLDTNIVSDLVRNPRGRAATTIARSGNVEIATSIVVACELRFGATRRGSAALLERLNGVLERLPVIAFDLDADARYGELRTALERAGQPIGANDMLIAAHALNLGATLVTDNVGEFERVEGLQIENWLR
jgi:tRNA(fMet)-specific endonuclease VapC